jgi:hypothetical protein
MLYVTSNSPPFLTGRTVLPRVALIGSLKGVCLNDSNNTMERGRVQTLEDPISPVTLCIYLSEGNTVDQYSSKSQN